MQPQSDIIDNRKAVSSVMMDTTTLQFNYKFWKEPISIKIDSNLMTASQEHKHWNFKSKKDGDINQM